MRRGGDSYYVLVNNAGDVYQVEDYTGSEVLEFNSWEDAEDELAELIDEEVLNEEDGWHVERHRW